MALKPNGAVLLIQALITRFEVRGLLQPEDGSVIVEQAVAAARRSGAAGWAVAHSLEQVFGRPDSRGVDAPAAFPKIG